MRACRSPGRAFSGPRAQRGAALYVALVMLILLALIGIVGMQVSSLQERMAANFLNVNLAFQNAEAGARVMERTIDTALSGEAGTFSADQEVCQPTFDPVTWADGIASTDVEGTSYTRRIDQCFPASSRRIGEKKNEQTGNIYEISTVAASHDDNASSTAVVSTIYIP